MSFQVRKDPVCVQSRVGKVLDLALVVQIHAFEDFYIFAELIRKRLLLHMHVYAYTHTHTHTHTKWVCARVDVALFRATQIRRVGVVVRGVVRGVVRRG